jgi:ATP-binding cassette subfamily F protein uup
VPAADPGGSDPVRRRELRKNLQRLDRQLDALHRKESELHNRMAEAAADFAAAADLARELDQVRAQVADVEIEWMTAAEELEES